MPKPIAHRARGRTAAVRRGRVRSQARAGDDDVRRRGRVAASDSSTIRTIAAGARAASGVPHLRRPRAGHGRRPRPACACRTSPSALRDQLLLNDRLPAPAEFVDPLPADVRARSWPRASRTPRSTATSGLLALNEVGGDPGRFGDAGRRRSTPPTRPRPRGSPAACSTAQTHDTKRSPDVQGPARRADRRARRVGRARRRVGTAHDGVAPRRRTRPTGPRSCSSTRRSSARGRSPASDSSDYLVKALREAKRTTTWIDPNEEWEGEVLPVRDRATSARSRVPRRFEPFVAERRARRGRAHRRSLEVVLRFTAPGVPDIYQGDELWDLSLVDPDNRRPVDWDARRARARRAAPRRSGHP